MEVVTRASLKVCPSVKRLRPILCQMSQSGLANQASSTFISECRFKNLWRIDKIVRPLPLSLSVPLRHRRLLVAKNLDSLRLQAGPACAGQQSTFGSKEEAFDYDGFLSSELTRNNRTSCNVTQQHQSVSPWIFSGSSYRWGKTAVMVRCSNDYLGMGKNEKLWPRCGYWKSTVIGAGGTPKHRRS